MQNLSLTQLPTFAKPEVVYNFIGPEISGDLRTSYK